MPVCSTVDDKVFRLFNGAGGPGCTMQMVPQKQTRRFLTIYEKKEIIRKNENGVRVVDLAAQFSMPTSSICTIIKNKEAIKAAAVAIGVKTLSAQRSVLHEEMENLLMAWINERHECGDLMTQAMICAKARSIFDELKSCNPSSGKEEFKASRGWFQKFKNRNQIQRVARPDELGRSGGDVHNPAPISAKNEATESDPDDALNWTWSRCADTRLAMLCGDAKMKLLHNFPDLLVYNSSGLPLPASGSRPNPESQPLSQYRRDDAPTTTDLQKLIHHWDRFQALVLKWHPDTAATEKLCRSVEEECLDHFRAALRRKQGGSRKRIMVAEKKQKVNEDPDQGESKVAS